MVVNNSCILTAIDLTLITYLNDNDNGKVNGDDDLALGTRLGDDRYDDNEGGEGGVGIGEGDQMSMRVKMIVEKT